MSYALSVIVGVLIGYALAGRVARRALHEQFVRGIDKGYRDAMAVRVKAGRVA